MLLAAARDTWSGCDFVISSDFQSRSLIATAPLEISRIAGPCLHFRFVVSRAWLRGRSQLSVTDNREKSGAALSPFLVVVDQIRGLLESALRSGAPDMPTIEEHRDSLIIL